MSETAAPVSAEELKGKDVTLSDPPKTSKPRAAAKASRGVHVAFDSDGKAKRIFSGEVDSLRYALSIGGTARHVGFGEDL